MSSVLFENKKKQGQCLTQHADDNNWTWDGYRTKNCDVNYDHQKINLTDKGSDEYQVMTRSAEMFISRQHLNWYDQPYDVRHSNATENNNKSHKSNRFIIQGVGKNIDKKGLEAVQNGPFTIGSATYFNYKLDADDKRESDMPEGVVRNFELDANKDSQKWIDHSLYNKCKERGISFDDCVATDLNNCTYDFNKDIFSACPRDYCSKVENVAKSECKSWCVENPGACDDTVIKYCAANPTDTEYCGCINIQKYDPLMKELSKKGTTMLPQCHIDQCVKASAYKTQSLKNTQCPTQQLCLQGVDVSALGASTTELSDFNFDCNLTLNENKPLESKKSRKKTNDEDEDEDEDNKKKPKGLDQQTIIYIGAGVGALVFFLILMILLM